MINLPRILRDNFLPSCLPSIPSKFSTPMICYKLGDTIGKKIFNFNKFVAGLDVTSFVIVGAIFEQGGKNSRQPNFS